MTKKLKPAEPQRSRLVSLSRTALRYGVCTRTITRWEGDEETGFPKSFTLNGRRYHFEDKLAEFDRLCEARAATRETLKPRGAPAADAEMAPAE